MKHALCYIAILIFSIYSHNVYADNINLNIQKTSTQNNVHYLYVEHHDLPAISLRFAFKKAGYAYDTLDKQGLAHFTSQILQKGSEDNNELDFTTQLDSKGIELKFEVDEENFYISLKTLSENLEEALSLLSGCIFNPITDSEIFNRVKHEKIANIKALYTSPTFIAATELNHAIFKGHPYSNKIYGTLHTLNNIEPKDIPLYIQNSFDKDQVVISATGDLDSVKLSALLDKYLLSNLPSGNNKNTIPNTTVNKEQKLLYVHRNIPQSVIMFATDTVPYNHQEYYASNLFNTILGGLTLNSILMLELRDKLGLTYYSGSSLLNMEHGNVLLGIITTDNSTVTKCISVLTDILENIKNQGIDEKIFSIAKSNIMNSFILSLLSNDNIASTLLDLQIRGLDPSYINKYNSHYGAITIKEVNKIAQEILSNELVIIEVGKNNNINGEEIHTKQNILGKHYNL
ncbi:insulinase family protein [Ehrlichia sp. JZT12]